MLKAESLDTTPLRPARIGDVAAAAGVSTATVSRALSNPETVKPETRERVLDAVRRLGYTPNEAARTLRAGAAHMAMVAAPLQYSGFFFSTVINGIETELAAAGYTMIIGNLDAEKEKVRRLVDLVYARQVDGVIVLANCVGRTADRSVLDAGVPVIAVSAELDKPGQPTVLIDDRAMAAAQTRHLLDLGHRQLLYVSGPIGHYNEVHRYRGFCEAASAAGLGAADLQRFDAGYSLKEGVAAGRRFLEQKRRATGVVCASDEAAIGFLKTVTDAGVKIPEEVSVVGFDDIEFSEYCTPALTTIRQPRFELGAMGARLLLRCLNGDPPDASRPYIIEGALTLRQSTGPAPRLAASNLAEPGRPRRAAARR